MTEPIRKSTVIRHIVHGIARFRLALLAVSVAALATACDIGDLLDVRDPDIVTPDDLSGPAGLTTLRAGALGDLALALSGSAAGHGATPGLILMSGLISDEWLYSGTFPTRREADIRTTQRRNGTLRGIYARMHRARAALQTAAEKLEEFSENPSQDTRIAEMRSLLGFTYVLFGETYCSGVPFSTALEDGTLEFGQPLSAPEMFQTAIQQFDKALSNTAGSATQQDLASIGRARALLNLGQFNDAATAVSGVGTNFVYNIEHSSNSLRQQNGIYILSTIRRQWSVPDNKGINGLPYRSANDPRVPWNPTGQNGQDDQTPYYNQLKYPSPDSPVPLATGIEARLIEAEAALQAGDITGFQQLHNDLRATVGLAPIDATTMTATEREDFHFYERAFWLWGTAHRQGDLRRLARQYGRSPDSVFPTGTYFKGGDYGPDVNFPVPVEEDNNPNFSGCLDRNP